MRNERGFTIVEMMVGSVVLLIVILITMSFFHSQSQYGGELVKDTGIRESLSAITMLIRHDVMHAGDALYDNPKLGIFADAANGGAFHRLYVNYAMFMNNIKPSGNLNVFNKSAVFQDLSSFTIPSVHPQDINGAISYDSTGQPQFNKAPGVFDPNTGSTIFTFTNGTVNSPFSPAFSYSLVDPTNNNDVPPYSAANIDKLEFRRAGVTLAGGSKEQFKILDFGVRFLFVDALGTETWLPNSTHTNFQDQPFSNLKTVEVQIKYKALRSGQDSSKSYNWRTYTKLFHVSPRNLVLTSFIPRIPERNK